VATEPVGRALILLDESALRRGAAELADTDPRLGRLFALNGVPPLWERTEGFATLVKIVLEQQVSLDSAAAAYANLEEVVGEVNPDGFLELDDERLRSIGFSRQKAAYCRGLAEGIGSGEIDLGELGSLDDDRAYRYLTSIRGVGPWTADVYLLFALRRPDIWPHGDRALVVSMAEHLPLDDVPDYDMAGSMADRWRPWRSVAARMLWHAYLAKRGRRLQ
jgi:DNA-3-methyladenine glycosylase II